MSDRTSTDAAQWRSLTPEQRDAISRHLAAGKASPTPMVAHVATSSRRPKEDRTGRNILLIGGGVVGAALLYGLLNVKPATPTAAPASGSASVASTTHASVPPAQPKPAQQAAATTTTSSDPDVRTDGGLDYLGLKAEAEEQLKAKLTDDHGVRYRDVRTRLSTLEGGGIVAFCGEENSRTPLGGYGGFRRFLASRSVAATEDTMSADDFAQAWSRFCTDGVEGPRVWF